ncbi:hypothetical protein WJX82_003695 [Trebouxia sp. C0006]
MGRPAVNEILPFLHLGAISLYQDPEAEFFARQKVDLIINVTKEKGLLERMQQMTGTVEKLADENSLLRQQAGLATDHIDVSGVQLAKLSSPAAILTTRPPENLIAELRAVNACLEREVGELKEERRRLKSHLKFSAKTPSQIQPDLGLLPEQLTAIESFIEHKQGRISGQ